MESKLAKQQSWVVFRYYMLMYSYLTRAFQQLSEKKKKIVDLLLLVIVHFLLHIGELWLTCYSHVQNASHLWLLCHFVFIKCGDNF